MNTKNLQIPNEKLTDFCRIWKITEMALFGSVLQQNFGPNSDIDILVTFARDTHYSLFDLARMQIELSEIFGREVDLVEKASIRNPFRRNHILNNLEIIHAT
ncbi:MAG: nucleotidyltransferase family protein [bacterium]